MIPADRWAVHEKLRLDLLEGRQTTPTYVTVDPKTDKKLAEHVLSGGPTAWEKGYRAFLEESLKAAGRHYPKPRGNHREHLANVTPPRSA